MNNSEKGQFLKGKVKTADNYEQANSKKKKKQFGKEQI